MLVFSNFVFEKIFKNVKICIKFIGRFMRVFLYFMINSLCIIEICILKLYICLNF